ncbi:hypothetical protein PAXRUDRAFT_177850, partial [Paxillus rubicundulus Ve08.2h10]
TDIMHLAGNISDLLITLWCGTMDCGVNNNTDSWDWTVLKDPDVWIEHGKDISEAGYHLPRSYDHKPCNIAEKINSQYKTWEFQLYTFGITPGLLHGILLQPYWENFCKLVRGFQIMCQHHIMQAELKDAHALLSSWEHKFEELYYQHKEDQIHFIHPCVHQISHLISKTIYKGPPICDTQWMMERTIGNLGQELRQPSKPFANLSQEGIRCCKVNSLISIIPELGDPPKQLPHGSVDLVEGFVLLCKWAKHTAYPTGNSAEEILRFLGPTRELPAFKKWAHLLLPNGQVVHSAWREKLRSHEEIRVSHNVKVDFLYVNLICVTHYLICPK